MTKILAVLVGVLALLALGTMAEATGLTAVHTRLRHHLAAV